jgi:hypothetical protein
MFPKLVLTGGKGIPIALERLPLASGERNEAWLRDFLLRHPETLPAAEIDPAYADPIPVCREMATPAGPVDALFVNRAGALVVVECKLWRNPQARREVVGQILDYAKELARWRYEDLQREVSRALRLPGNALFRLVAERHPGTDEAAFVDAVGRNLRQGRFLLLVAGDGIREGTEAIVQFMGEHSGMRFTFGLVEMAGYELPGGSLLVQPRILARTVALERTVIRVEGAGAGLAGILAPDEADAGGGVDEGSRAGGDAGARRRFDPAVLEADRRWRTEFVRRARFDDPAQAVGRVGYGRVFLELPVPWAWMTAYSGRSVNRCGNTLVLKGEVGREAFERLEAERSAIEAELAAANHGGDLAWRRRGDVCWVEAGRTFADGWWTAEQEPAQLEWLLDATNAFANAFRPRVRRLAAEATATAAV